MSAAIALKLEAAFGLEAGMLLGMQTDRNLARARARQAEITAHIQRFCPDVG
jgi:plasmid maintenance system antidote protein VapI